jgi:hypothetical protein
MLELILIPDRDCLLVRVMKCLLISYELKNIFPNGLNFFLNHLFDFIYDPDAIFYFENIFFCGLVSGKLNQLFSHSRFF